MAWCILILIRIWVEWQLKWCNYCYMRRESLLLHFLERNEYVCRYILPYDCNYCFCWDFFRIIQTQYYTHPSSVRSFNLLWKLYSLRMLIWFKHGFYTLVIHKSNVECIFICMTTVLCEKFLVVNIWKGRHVMMKEPRGMPANAH